MATSGIYLAGPSIRHFCASQPLHVPLASRWPGSSPFEAAPSTSSTSFWVASITVGTRSRSPCRHTERRHGPGTAPSNPSARRIVTTRVSLSRRPLTCSRCVLGYAAETDARRSRRRFSTDFADRWPAPRSRAKKGGERVGPPAAVLAYPKRTHPPTARESGSAADICFKTPPEHQLGPELLSYQPPGLAWAVWCRYQPSKCPNMTATETNIA